MTDRTQTDVEQRSSNWRDIRSSTIPSGKGRAQVNSEAMHRCPGRTTSTSKQVAGFVGSQPPNAFLPEKARKTAGLGAGAEGPGQR